MQDTLNEADYHLTRNRLKQCRVPQLVAACRFFNLGVSGSKDVVVQRVLDFIVTATREQRSQLPAALNAGPNKVERLTSIRVTRPVGVVIPDSSTSYMDSTLPLGDKFKMMFASIDPFYPVAPIEEPFLYYTMCRSGSINYSIDLLQLKAYRRQGYSVWLRGISLTSKERHMWPKELRVFVNMTQVSKIEEPKRLKKRRDDPIDLTPYLQSGRNQVQFSISDPNPSNFILAIILCSKVSDRSIVASVATQSKDTCLSRIQDILSSHSTDSDELVEENPRTLDLRCPVSLDKITVPAHGTACKHIRCFDLESFVSVNRCTSNMNLRWLCPICQQTIFPRDLIVDSYVAEILASTTEILEVVICTETASWTSTAREPPPMEANESVEDFKNEGSDLHEANGDSEKDSNSQHGRESISNEQEVIDLD